MSSREPVIVPRHSRAEPSRPAGSRSSSYTFDQIVLSQLVECVDLPPSKLFQRLDSSTVEQGKIKEETLVMLAREYRRRGKDGLAWKVAMVVCERVQPSMLRAINLWRLTPSIAEEMVESLVSSLYTDILNDDPDRFWEARFWVCFERRLLSLLRKYRIAIDRHVGVDLSDPVTEHYMTLASDNVRDWKDPALRALVAEGLAHLPDDLRTAFMLKHWAGFPEKSVDPEDKATISQIMGVSDRTVRNYLARAEVILNDWRGRPSERTSQGGTGNDR